MHAWTAFDVHGLRDRCLGGHDEFDILPQRREGPLPLSFALFSLIFRHAIAPPFNLLGWPTVSTEIVQASGIGHSVPPDINTRDPYKATDLLKNPTRQPMKTV